MKFIHVLVLCLLTTHLIVAQPVITSFTPPAGPAGTPVTITGTGFNATAANNTVYIGGVKSAVTAATATTLTVTVPASAGPAPIMVTVANLTGYSRSPFAVTSLITGTVDATTFPLRSDFPAGDVTQFVSLGDFDGDGKIDAAVANQGFGTGNTVSVYRNISSPGSISMTDQIKLTVNVSPSYIATADFDGDGKLDLAVSNNSSSNNTVSIFRNTSSGAGVLSFATKVDVAIDLHVFQLQSFDMDGNGKPDLLVRSNAGVSTVRNTSTAGTISFAPKVDMAADISPRDIQVVDFDGDGKRDIALTNFGPSPFTAPRITVFINNSTSGTITYAAGVHFALPAGSSYIVARDFDGDGKPDMIASTENPAPGISIFRNTSVVGTPSFAARQDIALSSTPAIFAAEIDGDGKPDLAFTDFTLFLQRNNSTVGTISFEPKVNTNYMVSNLSSADLDGDGKQDIAATMNSTNIFFAFRNSANESVITSVEPKSGGPGTNVVIGGVGLTNVSAVSFGGVAAASFQPGSPGYLNTVVGSGAPGPVSITTDKGTATWPGFSFSTKPIIYNGNGGAAEGSTYGIAGNGFSATATGNVVRFGAVKAEIVSAVASQIIVKVPNGATYGPVSVTTGGLTGKSPYTFTTKFKGAPFTAATFGQKVDFASAANPDGIAAGDLNSDGKPDLLVANPSNNTVSLFINSATTLAVPAFGAHTEISTGTNPHDVAVDDFDNDGNLDIAVSNTGAASVSVFRNLGNGTFASKVDVMAGSGAQALAVGDVDGDGRADIVVANKTAGSISVLLNTTTGSTISFATTSDFTVGTSPAGITIGDLNNDGRGEIVVTNSGSNTMSIFANKSIPGTLALAPKIDHITGTTPWGVAITFTNNKQQADVIVANKGSASITVFKASTIQGGLFTYFHTKTNFTTVASPESVSIADLDGDGLPDVVASSAVSISVLRNSSPDPFTFSFAPKIDYTAGTGVTDVAIVDLDLDGFPDIASANGGGANVSVLHNLIYNVLSFSPPIAGTGSTVTIKGNSLSGVTAVSFGGTPAASFNIVSSTTITAVVGAGASGAISLTSPLGTATIDGFLFSNSPAINTIVPLSGPVGTTVTITGDRFGATPAANTVRFGAVKAEVTSASATQLVVKVPAGATYDQISVTNNKYTTRSKVPFNVTFEGTIFYSTNSFAPKVDFTVGSAPENVALGDFDGDGKPDLVVANSGSDNVSVMENASSTSTIALTNIFDIETGAGPVGVVVADLDGDGNQDIATANSASNNISVIRNASVGESTSFQFKVDYATATNPQSIVLADLDMDGRPDLVTANFTNSGSVSILRNTSTSVISFAAKQDISTGSFPASVATGDFNNDGKPDLAVANSNSNSVSILLNNSSGSIAFLPKIDISVTASPFSLAVVDYDRDGDLDIMTGLSGSSATTILRNNGEGLFGTTSGPAAPTNPNWMTIADMNGDTHPDIVQTAGASTMAVIRNNSGVFTPISFTTEQDPSGIAVADINMDGLPDIINASRGAGKISVWKAVPASIISFSPTSAAKGTTVTITGIDMFGVTGVSFGGTPAISFSQVSPTTVTAVVNSGTSGAVTVTMSSRTISLEGFTYIPPVTAPTITSFAPTTASEGMTVLITGTNFTGVTGVTFGGVAPASYSVLTPTSISAVIGTGASGSVSVVTPSGTATLAGFTFETAPVTAVEPDLAGELYALNVFPNPSPGSEINFSLHPTWDGTQTSLDITDMTGRRVVSSPLVCREMNRISLTGDKTIRTGVYVISVTLGGKKVIRKIMVTE